MLKVGQLKITLTGILLAVLATMPLTAAHAAASDDIFNAWLVAFNSGDKTNIQAFYGERLDDVDAVNALQLRTATCGFDLVRIEDHSAANFSAILAERCFPALRRITFTILEDGENLKDLRLRSFAMSEDGAIAATEDIAERLTKLDEFAGSVLIAKDGLEPWSFNSGTFSQTNRTPINADTPMLLASAGKMFTAISVLQLVEVGKVDLDAPFGRYVTDYPNKVMAKVTIRQLLSHRGGTGADGILRREDTANRAGVRTINDFIALNGNRAPDFPPGSKADYSNYGFILLGAVIERVSGQSYQDYVTEHIFKPADMNNSGFPDRNHMDGLAEGYTTFFGEEDALVSNRSVLPWQGSAAGGGSSTANDMMRFVEALEAGSLIDAATLKKATTAGDTPWYGMGFILAPSPHVGWGHGGFSYGMNVGVQRLPDDRTTVICFATRDMACDRIMNAWYWRSFGLSK